MGGMASASPRVVIIPGGTPIASSHCSLVTPLHGVEYTPTWFPPQHAWHTFRLSARPRTCLSLGK